MTAEELIQKYELLPHPEGGWYKETYRSKEMTLQKALPGRFSGDRAFATAIYFLLEQGNFSAFHKIKSDESWHFYAGQTLQILIIQQSGELETVNLGNDLDNGDVFQFVVPANCWFASRPAADTKFSFVGCTVSPGFDFKDFELAHATTLSLLYPQHKNTIIQLCRK